MTPEGTSGLGLPTVPLPGAMASPDHASLHAVFVGDSAVDSADREQLTRKDLMPMGVFIFHLTMYLLTDFNRIASQYTQRGGDLGRMTRCQLSII